MIPGPKNLVFADRFFPYWSHWGFLFLLGFPHLKIKMKSKWRLQTKTIPLGERIFQKSKQTNFPIFLHFKSESRWPVDRVGSTGGWAINCERSLIWIFMGDNINVNVFS